MTFDELWRRNLPSLHPVISSTDSQTDASFFCDSAFNKYAFDDVDETEMNQFLECLEGTLLIDSLDEGGA